MLFRFEPVTPKQSKALRAQEKASGCTSPAMDPGGVEPPSYLVVSVYKARRQAQESDDLVEECLE